MEVVVHEQSDADGRSHLQASLSQDKIPPKVFTLVQLFGHAPSAPGNFARPELMPNNRFGSKLPAILGLPSEAATRPNHPKFGAMGDRGVVFLAATLTSQRHISPGMGLVAAVQLVLPVRKRPPGSEMR